MSEFESRLQTAKRITRAGVHMVAGFTGLDGAIKGWIGQSDPSYPYDLDILALEEALKKANHAEDYALMLLKPSIRKALFRTRVIGAAGRIISQLAMPQSFRSVDIQSDWHYEALNRGINIDKLRDEEGTKTLLEIGSTVGAFGVAIIGGLVHNPEMVTGAVLFLGLRNIVANLGWEIYHFDDYKK